jgi:hypothetical protein
MHRGDSGARSWKPGSSFLRRGPAVKTECYILVSVAWRISGKRRYH